MFPAEVYDGRGGEDVDVFQCPHCELRFRNESELQQHIAFDHPDRETRRSAEDDLMGSHRHRHRDRQRGHESSP
jgi:uncharacterized C2H2 Zn-finger protein